MQEGVEDDPLEDEVLRAEQLDVVAQLGRCKYSETAKHLLDKVANQIGFMFFANVFDL